MPTYNPDDLRAWFREKAEDYFRANPGLDPAWYRDVDDFTPDEAKFLWAVDAGIVDVDATGNFNVPGINRSTRKPTEPGVFSSPKTALRNQEVKLEWREYLVQVVALAELVLEYGWPKELLALHPGDWTFDLAAFRDRTGGCPWVFAAEAKTTVSARQLDRLASDVLAWSEDGRSLEPSDNQKHA